MSARKTCESCGAFSPLTNECRRESPKPFPLNNGGQLQMIGGWPGVTKDGWCMSHMDPAPELPAH